jgi:hypothetical protein
MNAPRRNTSGRAKPRRTPPQAPVRDDWVFSAHDVDEPAPKDPVVIRPAVDPTALIRSLGAPPLPGGETAAEHYFAVVYERAAALAIALAAASELLAPDVFDNDDEQLTAP